MNDLNDPSIGDPANTTMALDELSGDGPVFERGFWRPPTGGTIVYDRKGKRRVYGSPSARWKSHCENTYNLQKWSERAVATGAVLLSAIEPIELPEELESKESKRWLDGLALRSKEEAGAMLAAARGTHGHLLAELDDTGAHWLTMAEAGEELGLPTLIQSAIVDAWRELLKHHDLEVLAVEQTVVSTRTQTAGTLDRTARCRSELVFGDVTIPAGTVVVLDVKTGKLETTARGLPEYWDGYGVQVLCYATGVPVTIDPLDPLSTKWGRWPKGCKPSEQHAVIAHLDIAEALETGIVNGRLVYVDLAKAKAMERAVQVVRRARNIHPFAPILGDPEVRAFASQSTAESVPPTLTVVPPIEPEAEDEAEAGDEPETPVEEQTPVALVLAAFPGSTVEPVEQESVPYDEVMAWLQGRLDALDADGRKLAAQLWPREAKPPKAGMAVEHVDLVDRFLTRVERETSAPFGAPDPRIAKSGHKSERTIRPVAPPTTHQGA